MSRTISEDQNTLRTKDNSYAMSKLLKENIKLRKENDILRALIIYEYTFTNCYTCNLSFINDQWGRHVNKDHRGINPHNSDTGVPEFTLDIITNF